MNAAVGALSERGIFLPEAEEEAALASWSIHWIPRIPELLQCWKTQCTSRLSFLCDLIGKELTSDWLHALLSGPYDEAFWQQQRSIAQRLAQQSAQLLPDRDLLRLFTSLRRVFWDLADASSLPPAPFWDLLEACHFVIAQTLAEERLHASILSMRDLLQQTDLEIFFRRAADLACQIAGADGAGLIVPSGSDRLRYRFFHGLSSRYQSLLAEDFPDDQGSAGAALQSGAPVYLSDYAASTQALPAFVEAGLRASLALPLRVGSENVRGVLVLSWFQTKPPERIPQWDWEHLRLLADLLAANLYREQLEAEMTEHATRDSLTGLPNRRVVIERIHHAMARAMRYQHLFALIFLDLDGFKPVNDQLGHATGDQVLQAVAQDLRAALRMEDCLIRYAGDEFVVLAEDLAHVSEAYRVAQRLLDAARRSFSTPQGRGLSLSASAGIVLYPFLSEGPEELLHQADKAMYQAKQAGGDRFSLVAADTNNPAIVDSLRDRLFLAWQRREFVLYWQPIVSFAQNRIIGAEALLRWQDPEKGLAPCKGIVAPGEFLELLESLPIMRQVGAWILETAIAQAADWHARGLQIDVHINLAAVQLEGEELLHLLRSLLARYSAVMPQHLQLEIVERVDFVQLPRVAQLLQACRKTGVQFAFDDFGSGYAALQNLNELGCEGIKLDKSLIQPLLQEEKNLKLVQGMASLARGLGVHLVAEGVETQETAEALASIGIDRQQGYLYSRPIPAEEFARILVPIR
ncbi:EAL domain-containing protein [Igneacidithiobacillus siniensis]|uniref:putative bifunctional diguanylate cyclase/phosphodiesterase n=1 Tax=Acidithiobacillus TaxID=119977 RepID=UPI002010C5EE|nr:EAL domain-containing protein [Acidithiobacillus sp. S30A2]